MIREYRIACDIDKTEKETGETITVTGCNPISFLNPNVFEFEDKATAIGFLDSVKLYAEEFDNYIKEDEKLPYSYRQYNFRIQHCEILGWKDMS